MKKVSFLIVLAILITGLTVISVSASQIGVRIEAESATPTNMTPWNNGGALTNASGGEVMNSLWPGNDNALEFNVNVTEAGLKTIVFGYSMAAGTHLYLPYYVNGIKKSNARFTATGDWNNFNKIYVTAYFNAGANTIKIDNKEYFDVGGIGIMLDYLEIHDVIEAEGGLSNAYNTHSVSNASSGKVFNSIWPGSGVFLNFDYLDGGNGGYKKVQIRYSKITGDGNPLNVPVTLNNNKTMLAFPVVGGDDWNSFGTVEFVAWFNEGANNNLKIDSNGATGSTIGIMPDYINIIDMADGALYNASSWTEVDNSINLVADYSFDRTNTPASANFRVPVDNSGREGNGIYVNGQTGSDIIIGDSDALDLNDIFTISVFVKPIAHGNYLRIIDKYGTSGYILDVAPDGKPRILLSQGDGNWKWYNIETSLETNKWTHIVICYWGTAQGLKAYYNGNEKTVSLVMGSKGNVVAGLNNAADFKLATSQSGTDNFNGYIDELKIYKGICYPEVDRNKIFIDGLDFTNNTVSITTDNQKPQPITSIVSKYNILSDELLYISTANATITSGMQSVNMGVLSPKGEGEKIKAFVWNSFFELTPLALPFIQ